MKKLLYITLSVLIFACGSDSDDDNLDNNISELIGIYKVIWVETESNTIDFCPGTLEFKSDDTSEAQFDDDGDDICGNEDIRISRTYEITFEDSNVIKGNLGTDEGGLLSATMNGVDLTETALGDEPYLIKFEYNKNTEKLIYNLYIEANDLIVYMYQKI